MSRVDVLEALRAGVSPGSGVPVYVQMSDVLRALVAGGQLNPGDALPTVRAVAEALGLAVNTVAKTYAALAREGLTVNRAGAGTVVADGAWRGSLDEQAGLRELAALVRHLRAAGLLPEALRAALEGALAEASGGLEV